MKHLDLFSGIGGFALAARRVGWETVGFCEIEPYCQKVLAKHWPGVPIYDDVRKIVADPKSINGKRTIGEGNSGGRSEAQIRNCGSVTDGTTTVGPVDIITGGFPCQDISYAGKGAGIEGERSGLWTELARIIGEVRPRWAVLENVAALLSRGLDRVAGDLAKIGYDCEWHCIPASAVGAPHRRDRIWIVAYPNGNDTRPFQRKKNGKPQEEVEIERGDDLTGLCADVADTISERQPRSGEPEQPSNTTTPRIGQAIDAFHGCFRDQWATEPNVGRVANGIPARVDRLRGLGNAIVPQCAELIFNAIKQLEDGQWANKQNTYHP